MHLRLGSSSRRICCRTMTSKAMEPTNNDGADPWNNYNQHSSRCLVVSYRRVVQDCSNVQIFHILQWIHGFDGRSVNFMKHKAYSGATTKFQCGDVRRVSLQIWSEIVAEIGNHRQYEIGLESARASHGGQTCIRGSSFAMGSPIFTNSCWYVCSDELIFSLISGSLSLMCRVRIFCIKTHDHPLAFTMLSFVARYGVPQ